MVQRKAIPWPQLAEGRGAAGELPKAYRVEGTPSFYVLDRAGRIFARLNSANELESQLKEALATPAGAPPRQPRDAWQRPLEVMDALGISAGMQTADVGAGGGYFTLHLAARVGPSGRVLAQDIDAKVLEQLRAKARQENFPQVETVLGTEDDPRLPANSLEAVLIVDAYHEFLQPAAMLTGVFRSLKEGGRLGILDFSGPLAKPRTEYNERHDIPAELVIEEAARIGFRLRSFGPEFVRTQGQRGGSYLLIFEKPTAKSGESR